MAAVSSVSVVKFIVSYLELVLIFKPFSWQHESTHKKFSRILIILHLCSITLFNTMIISIFLYISTNYISVISHIHVRLNLNLGTYVWITACPFSLGAVSSDKLRIDENSRPAENTPLGLVAPQLKNYVQLLDSYLLIEISHKYNGLRWKK